MGRSEWVKIVVLLGVFLACYALPSKIDTPIAYVGEGLALTGWYAREHVILCLLPAFLLAGAISAFVDKAAIIRYLGPDANRLTAYAVGATGGCLLAVCSCTVLPLFAGLRRMGAGLGPTVAFLYAGPAINVLAIILTARVLGVELGIARTAGAVGFSLIVGLLMAGLFEKRSKAKPLAAIAPNTANPRPAQQLLWLFGLMITILVFANWGAPAADTGVWRSVFEAKWTLTAGASVGLGIVLWKWFGFSLPALSGVGIATASIGFGVPSHPDLAFATGVLGLCVLMLRAGGAAHDWFVQSWSYAKQITPLLILGVFLAGVLLGRPGSEGAVPFDWISASVGGNTLSANLTASVLGTLMYFATLTEVPIIEGLLGAGMGRGPALALLLAGPALSLPNMLVIRTVIGSRKTLAYVGIVAAGSALLGLLYATIA